MAALNLSFSSSRALRRARWRLRDSTSRRFTGSTGRHSSVVWYALLPKVAFNSLYVKELVEYLDLADRGVNEREMILPGFNDAFARSVPGDRASRTDN